MRSPSLRAARPLLALLAAGTVAAIAPAPALAQADPFALPPSLTADSVQQADTGPVLAEIVVDGASRRRLVSVEGRGRTMTIDADDARTAGLPIPGGAQGAISIASLNIYQWKFDPLRQLLTVTLFRSNDGVNFRDLTARKQVASESSALTAIRLDYDLTASATPNGVSVGGFVDAAAVRGNLSLGSSARLLSSPPPGSAPFVRLDSKAQFLWEAKQLVATAGDFVSAGSQSQRPVRMGGIKIATDFDLRPDLVTAALPAFSGSVAVPTTIDLVGANQRLSLGKIEPGDFTVRNIPVQPGRGEISAVLRDALGRERTETARFYVSRDLLAPRRSAYAINAGFVRRRFGEVSNDYGPFAASAFFRRGLSPHLTVEGSGEWTPGTANIGARADFTIASIAKATVEARVSHDADVGAGKLLNLGLESVSERFGVAVGATLPSATYRDVASRLGDSAPPKQLFANAYYRVGPNIQAQVGFVRRESRADARFLRPKERTDTATASLQLPITERIRFYGSTDYRSFNGKGVFGLSGGLSIAFGPARNAALYARHAGETSAAGARYSRDDAVDGDVGYSFGAQVTESGQSAEAGFAWRARMMRVEGQIEEIDGRFAGRASARGSLLLAGGTLYALNRSDSGYVLVRSGSVPDIPVTLENRFVGRTNSRGHLLVQDVPAQVAVKIDVASDKLPAQALVRETEHTIRVPKRWVARVDIDAVRFIPVMRMLVDSSGLPLPPGLRVRALPSGETTLTGFDGLVEVNAGAADTRLMVGSPGSGCVVNLTGLDLTGAGDAPLRCERAVIAADEDEPAAGRGKARGGKRVARRD